MKVLTVLLTSMVAIAVGCSRPSDEGAGDSSRGVVARVLGREITSEERDSIHGIILGALREGYAKDHDIEPTQGEIEAFMARSDRWRARLVEEWEADFARLKNELESTGPSDSERRTKKEELELVERLLESERELSEWTGEEARESQRKIARSRIRAWKFSRELYNTYGGRVVFQQFGAEPLDATLRFLREREAAGSFEIFDDEVAAYFWQYFTGVEKHMVMSAEEGKRAMTTPWWVESGR